MPTDDIHGTEAAAHLNPQVVEGATGGTVASVKTGPRAPIDQTGATDPPQGPPVVQRVAAGSGGAAAEEAEDGGLGAGAGQGKRRPLRAALRVHTIGYHL